MPFQNKQLLKTIFCLFLITFLFFGPFSKNGKADGDKSWQELPTKYTIIYYHSPDDLIAFDNKIDYSGFKTMLSSPEQDTGKIDKKINNKVDAIYSRVQAILDMQKKVKNKVKIRIYQDRKQLLAAYFNIYRKKGRLRGWYIYEYNTIYLNVKDLHEGMLAHEIAHSIIDHYLSVKPPRATAEILARYVDKHLVKKRKKKR